MNFNEFCYEEFEGTLTNNMSHNGSSQNEKKLWFQDEDKKLAVLYNQLKDKFELKEKGIWVEIAKSFKVCHYLW